MKVILPIKTVSLTNQREHWKVRHRRNKNQNEVIGLLMPKGVPVPCTVRLTRIAPSMGLDPHDNLPASLKNAVDQIARLSGVDDRDPRIKWEYAQERGPAKVYEVHVEVLA